MKRIIIILVFLVCGISSAQQYFFNGTVYVPKTTVQINAITAPANGHVEANSDTGSLWYFDGDAWKDTFVGVSSFADLEGSPYDNTMLSDALNSKAADSVVVKTSVDSQIQNLKLAVGDSAWIASKTFGANDIVINTDENPPGGDNYVTGGTLSGAGVLSLEMNYGPDITVPGFSSGNFVDLTTNQNVGGVKNFTNRVSQSGLGGSTFFGQNAGVNDDLTNNSNAGFGYEALRYTTTGEFNSSFNTALNLNTTGSSNSAFGRSALASNTTASFNSALGVSALGGLTTGSSNNGFGRDAGRFIADGETLNTTGSTSLFIGNLTKALADGQSNQIVIGNNAIGGGSNTVTLGNSSITTLRAQVTSITALSDARDKMGVDYIHNALGIVEDLNPVIFIWNQRDGGKVGKKATGFLAQELLETQNNSEIGEYLDLVDETNPDRLEARYGHLIPLMVKAIQELQARIIELENR